MTSTLTTRIKKQEQLRMESETEKMRANLLRAVSHDLRTPLTSIYGACSTVIDNYDSLGREQKIKLLSEACADAQWLNRMVENLLSVTRIDADGVAIQKTPTVLEELVDTVLVRFQKLHPGVPVEVKLPDDFIVIPMDSMLIQQVLTNLLENAVLHAEGMTHLTLRVFTLGRRAVFEVIDNGCGIPKEQLKRLFSGTTLAQDTSSSGKHGMGIGLSVCAAIIKAHGGEIKAADLCEHVESVVSVRRIDRNGFLNDGLFPGERFIRYAAAATRHGLHRRVQQYREHGGGRCCVADAHLADAEHVRVRFRGKLDAGEHRALALLARHGAAAGDILRAVGDLAA